MTPGARRVVVLAWGNPSRGDDALGPLLVERLERWLAAHPEADVTIVCDMQLQIEHALELEGRDLAVFVDAAAAGPAPFALTAATPAWDPSYTSHALSPEAVLEVYRRVRGSAPPPAQVLALRGYGFELGAPPTEAALANLDAGWNALVALLAPAGPAG